MSLVRFSFGTHKEIFDRPSGHKVDEEKYIYGDKTITLAGPLGMVGQVGKLKLRMCILTMCSFVIRFKCAECLTSYFRLVRAEICVGTCSQRFVW